MSAVADPIPLPGVDPEEDATRLLADLHTQTGGLDEREAARRLLQVGGNEIRRESGPRWWRRLLWGIAFELVFAAALIYLPPLQSIFHTAALGLTELALLASFPVIVWGSDELRRSRLRRHVPIPTGAP
jgi:hypothetical protein